MEVKKCDKYVLKYLNETKENFLWRSVETTASQTPTPPPPSIMITPILKNPEFVFKIIVGGFFFWLTMRLNIFIS